MVGLLGSCLLDEKGQSSPLPGGSPVGVVVGGTGLGDARGTMGRKGAQLTIGPRPLLHTARHAPPLTLPARLGKDGLRLPKVMTSSAIGLSWGRCELPFGASDCSSGNGAGHSCHKDSWSCVRSDKPSRSPLVVIGLGAYAEGNQLMGLRCFLSLSRDRSSQARDPARSTEQGSETDVVTQAQSWEQGRAHADTGVTSYFWLLGSREH